MHTWKYQYNSSTADRLFGLQLRTRGTDTFLSAARILDTNGGVCPQDTASLFEYSTDGVTWNSGFVPGTRFINYKLNTDQFKRPGARTDGCTFGVKATAHRDSPTQAYVDGDLYVYKDATEATLHDQSKYKVESGAVSESDFTLHGLTLTSDPTGTVNTDDVIHYTATYTNQAAGASAASGTRQAKFEIDLTKLVDDATVSNVVASAGTVTSTDTAISWSNAAMASGAQATVTFDATVVSGGDKDLRAVINGPTDSTFSLMTGPRSDCLTRFGPAENWYTEPKQSRIMVNGTIYTQADVGAMTPAQYATAMGTCAAVNSFAASVVADANGPYAVDEGSGVTLDATATTGAGAGATYAWDLNGDGVYDDANGAEPTVSAAGLAALGLGDGPGTRTVGVRVSDGATVRTATSTLTVANVAPTATLTVPGSVVAGTPVTITPAATDPSAADSTAGFTYTIDYGDGTTPDTVRTHTYASAGTYTVSVTATDKDNGTSTTTTTQILVTPMPPPGTSSAGGPVVVIASPADTSTTRDTTPTIVGRATPGSLVTVTLDGEVLGTVRTDAEGSWRLTPQRPLSYGEHTVRATVPGAEPASSTFTVTAAPPVVVGAASGDPDDTLPVTGSPTAGIALVGLLCVLAGSAAVWSLRPGPR
ncbi:PKD domain-containing protein [Actinoplanes sp. NPDC049668]|uniref:PKD domain-containing protein n=1 Tax=unclassified Actinoplanes TaxID=2626549 RepID=UPI0033B3984F